MKIFASLALLTALIVPLAASPALAQEHHRPGYGSPGPQHYGPGPGHYRSSFDHRGQGGPGNWRHGWHNGRYGSWWVVDGFWSYYPSAPTVVYPYPVRAPVIVEPARPTFGFWFGN